MNLSNLIGPLAKASSECQEEPLLGRVDADQIAQVFDALLSNAIRYSAGGKVIIRVGQGQNKMIHIMIEDSGPGIDIKHQSKIFQPFYQVNTTAMYSHNGLGIGLSIAKDIVKSHGGEMWVKSEPGKNAVFHFTLPPTRS